MNLPFDWPVLEHSTLGTMLGVFLRPGSTFSLNSLAVALLVATGWLVWRRLSRGRKVQLRTIWRGLFPARIWKSRSVRADIWLFLLNTMLMGLMLGWAIIGLFTVSEGVRLGLVSLFGAREPTGLADWQARLLMTVVLFLAYEFGYWLDHALKHAVPFLWEFHKVHHSAEHLTPLTAFRMHPGDSLIFANILAVTLGLTNGVGSWALGGSVTEYTVTGTNAILVVFMHLYIHLQHSHVWIPFRGWLGRILMSPAHHQIHHSLAPEHFNKNMGSCLSIWDWLFGTLYVPPREPGRMRFGIDPEGRDVHDIGEVLIGPVRDAAGHLRGRGEDQAIHRPNGSP